MTPLDSLRLLQEPGYCFTEWQWREGYGSGGDSTEPGPFRIRATLLSGSTVFHLTQLLRPARGQHHSKMHKRSCVWSRVGFLLQSLGNRGAQGNMGSSLVPSHPCTEQCLVCAAQVNWATCWNAAWAGLAGQWTARFQPSPDLTRTTAQSNKLEKECGLPFITVIIQNPCCTWEAVRWWVTAHTLVHHT